MKKQKYYWKVCIESSSKNNTFESSNTSDPMALLKYEIGKKTVPNVGKIFVFDTRKSARIYRNKNKKYSILKVLASNVSKAQVRGVSNSSWRVISHFWNDLYKSSSYLRIDPLDGIFSTPDGTYFADSVIPIEKSH